MDNMDKKQFAIASSGSYEIEKISAKTLRGAKAVASRTFSQSLNGKIKVYEVEHYPEGDNFVEVAIKYGYDKKWTNL